MYPFWGHGSGMLLSWIVGIVILILIFWFVVKALNQGNEKSRQGDKTPLDILKERYARGEIDKEEFDRRKKDLM